MLKTFQSLLTKRLPFKNTRPIIVITGLPRSGTSMLMQMCSAGGVHILTDNYRKKDTNNPKGYHELEKVKKLKEDISWLPEAKGKAVKIVSPLLMYLPDSYSYKAIFIQRNLQEVLASQREMVRRLGTEESPGANDQELEVHYHNHLNKIYNWLEQKNNFETIFIRHRDILTDPVQSSRQIESFLGLDLDAQAMAACVDQNLYRKRKG